MQTPKIVEQQLQDLIDLIEKDDRPYILPNDAAKFMGIDPACFRMLAERGKLPFAVGGKENAVANRVFRIPKLAFWNWFQGRYEA